MKEKEDGKQQAEQVHIKCLDLQIYNHGDLKIIAQEIGGN